MKIPLHKTKIVCTIGPACRAPHQIEQLINNGMNVARLNFSHADFSEHKENIQNLHKAAAKLKHPLSILIDLPGVKMRIGKLKDKSLILKKGERVTLTTKTVLGTHAGISVTYKKLPQSVSKGSIIYLSDGFIQLKVETITNTDIHCRVVIGGVLLNQKGINLPGSKVIVDPITAADLAAVEFGLKHGITTFGLSFVERAEDIRKLRRFARSKGKDIFVVAKIERREAVKNYDEILKEADAIMVARGDLGIEVPLEEVPVIQKMLIRKANAMARPVITATQMLGSMTNNIRPTRAEVNDVANAIVDGTDAIMLSEETAVGEFAQDAVLMMTKIARSTEALCQSSQTATGVREEIKAKKDLTIPDVISLNTVSAAERLNAKYILAPSSSGNTVRLISRFKPVCWILSFTIQRQMYDFLNFSYGVYPCLIKNLSQKNPPFLLKTIKGLRLAKKGDTVIITERRLSRQVGETDTLGILTLEG